jgi:hypothetical protein
MHLAGHCQHLEDREPSRRGELIDAIVVRSPLLQSLSRDCTLPLEQHLRGCVQVKRLSLRNEERQWCWMIRAREQSLAICRMISMSGQETVSLRLYLDLLSCFFPSKNIGKEIQVGYISIKDASCCFYHAIRHLRTHSSRTCHASYPFHPACIGKIERTKHSA